MKSNYIIVISFKSAANWAKNNLCTPTVCTSLAFLIFLAARVYAQSGVFSPLPWDAGWYHGIAMHGYSFDGNYANEASVVFSPAYPMFARLVMFIGDSSDPLMMNVASFLLTIASSAFLFSGVRQFTTAETATLAVLAFLFNPFSMYLFNGYSETASAVAMSGLFWCLASGRIWWAASFVALAALCRPQGVLLLPIFAGVLLINLNNKYRSKTLDDTQIYKAALQLCFASSGFIGYSAWQYLSYGDPLLSFHIRETAWLGTQYTISIINLPLKLYYSSLTILSALLSWNRSWSTGVGHLCFWVAVLSVTPIAIACHRRIAPLIGMLSIAFPVLVICFLYRANLGYELGRYIIGFPQCFVAFSLYRLAAQEGQGFAASLCQTLGDRRFFCVSILLGSIISFCMTVRYFRGVWI